jgi:nicotinamide riboside transporter PnuC
VWFVVNVVATGVYVTTGLYFLAVLYTAYLGLSIAGWRTWQASLRAAQQPAAGVLAS